MTRVLCIGHPLHPEDQAGPGVYQRLREAPLPPRVELVEGGLQGLNLLRYFEQSASVILVDSLKGFGTEPGVVHLHGEEIGLALGDHYDHGAGLAYLLAILPEVLDNLPQIELVGIEGEVNSGTLDEAAGLVLKLLS